MKISAKLLLGFLTVAACVAAVGYFAHTTNRSIETQVNQLSRNSLIEVIDSTEMALSMNASHLKIYDLIGLSNRDATAPPGDVIVAPFEGAVGQSGAVPQEQVDEARLEIRSHLNSFQRSLNRSRQATQTLYNQALSSGDKSLAAQQKAKLDVRYKQLSKELHEHREYIEKCLQLASHDLVGARQFARETLHAHFRDDMFPLIDDQRAVAEGEFTQQVNHVERAIADSGYRNRLAAIVAILAAVLLGLVIARSIGRPLGELQAAAADVGRGLLGRRIEVRSQDEIGLLAESFNQMAADLQATTVSKAYVDNILLSMREMLIVTDAQCRVEKINPAAVELLGFGESELIGQPLASLFEDPTQFRCDCQNQSVSVESPENREVELRTRGGNSLPVLLGISQLRDAQGVFQGLVCTALSIADRKVAEQRLRDSLGEKEVLLKEVHHRVKNNLQVISSLLTLQARESDDPAVAGLFQESQGRIRSMALIHEQLYRSEDLSRIDFAQYVARLSEQLSRSAGAALRGVMVHVDVEPVPLALDVAIPCGMIVNELVSNAMKHAFPAGRSGRIDVEFRVVEGKHELIVSDNGVGLEPGDPLETKSLGLKVVAALVRQLGGQLEISGAGGARFVVRYATDALLVDGEKQSADRNSADSEPIVCGTPLADSAAQSEQVGATSADLAR